jgi:hypothetical protein
MPWFKRKPKLGTPENPEILMPGERPRVQHSRLPVILGLVRWAVVILTPVILADTLCYWLLELGRQPDGSLAWLFLALFALPALILNFIAGAVLLVLFFSLLMLVMGRSVSVMRFDRR